MKSRDCSGGSARPSNRSSCARYFATRTEARLRIATWITGFYNTHRLHSVCGFKSPIDYEHGHRANSTLELAAQKVSTVGGD